MNAATLSERIRPSKKEWLSALLVLPVLASILNYILYKERLWDKEPVLLYSFLITVVLILGFWYVYILSVNWLRIQLPDIKQTTKRVLLLAAIHLGLIILACSLVFYIYDAFHFLGYSYHKKDYIWALIIGGSATLIISPLREGIYLFSRWKESLVQKEITQQLSIKQEFELLKQQVDPHFLFNCFNTLSSLITEDLKRAEYFLNELRKVYHYLLSNKKEDFVSVEQELQFIRSYFTLLQTRFGTALELTITVNEAHLQCYIPSLSLQLLVENAVKHNIVSKSRKLFINITSTDKEELVITNNLQRKLVKSRSFGIGMETIKAKYKLVQQRSIEVIEDGIAYTVILPFIDKGRMVASKAATL